MSADNLDWLGEWYLRHANGDWEHRHGIKVGTIDNPGWRVQICLAETSLSTKSFDKVEIERSDNDWTHCWIANQTFEIACGPMNLNQALGIFRNWVES
jgi:hypothetical protein